MYPPTSHLVPRHLLRPRCRQDLGYTRGALVDDFVDRGEVKVEDFGESLALLLQEDLGENHVERVRCLPLGAGLRRQHTFHAPRCRRRASDDEILVLQSTNPLISFSFGVHPGTPTIVVLVVNTRTILHEQVDDLSEGLLQIRVSRGRTPMDGLLDSDVEGRSSLTVPPRHGRSPLEEQAFDSVGVRRLHGEVQSGLAMLVFQVYNVCVPEKVGEADSQPLRLCDGAPDDKRAFDGVHDRAIVRVVGALESAQTMGGHGLLWEE